MHPAHPLPHHLRGRLSPPIDNAPIDAWGESVSSFGGTYYTDDQESLVVLFTDDPELYRDTLSRLTPVPERLILRRTSRSQAEIYLANEAVQRALISGDDPHPNVISVGLTMDGDEWVIHVAISPYTEEIAAQVRELVAPEAITVTYEEQPSEY